MRFWNIVQPEGKDPEIRIEGLITMEQDFWDWLMGKKDRSMTAIEQEILKLDGKNITVWINSYGGEVYAGALIYTVLKAHKGKVTVKISGMAASAASVIAMAGDEVLMSPVSIMMIHNPLTYVEGEAKDMLKAVEVLAEVKETIMNAYTAKTNLSRKEISDLMDAETWMGITKAKKMGFADGVLFEGTDGAEEPDVQNIAAAKRIYNALSVKSIDMEQLKKVLAENDTEDNRPNEGGFNLPEDEPKDPDGKTEAEEPSQDTAPTGMSYARYTCLLKNAQMRGEQKNA